MTGVRFPGGQGFFSTSPHLDRLWGTPNLIYSGCWGSFLGLKQAGNEADHWPPSRMRGACLHGEMFN